MINIPPLIQAAWRRADKKSIYIPAILLLCVIILEIGSTTFLPEAKKPLFDSMESLHYQMFVYGVFLYCGVYFLLAVAQGFKAWLGHRVALVLREALMKAVKKDWINNYERVTVTNPCSRLNDDVRCTAEGVVNVVVELVISGCIVVGLILGMIHQPKLLIAAIIYSAISISLAVLFKKSISDSRYHHLNAEGQHRIALTMISVGQGDYTSKPRWETVKATYLKYISVLRNYKSFSALQMAVMMGVPFFILAPEFFSKAITLGDVMKGVSAFDLLVVNAAIWVQIYPQVTDVMVGYKRIQELYKETMEQPKI